MSLTVLRIPTVEAGTVQFTRLSPINGMSNRRVSNIIQDPLGYMWLGTQYGLDRYDGYEFKVFVHDPHRPASLAGDFVTALFRDREGTIWVACSQVLDRFDAKTETFTHYRIDSDDKQIGDGTVFEISQDSTGFLWLSTGRGLHRMDPKTGALAHFYHEAANPSSLSTNDIKSSGEDRSGRFWVGTARGLEQFDRATGRVLLRVPMREDGVTMRFFEDRQGRFWIIHTSGTGLALFDRQSNTLTHVSFYAADPPPSASTGVMAVLEDRDGQLWFGSQAGGILKFDHEHQRFLRYRFRGGSSVTPVGAEDEVISLAEDSEGDIWAGLHGLGVNHFSRQTAAFRIYRHEPEDPNSLDVDFVNAVYADKAGTVWIGNELGLNRVDPSSGRRELVKLGLGPRPSVISITGDDAGIVWVGTHDSGLARYDPRTGEVRVYQHDPKDPTSLSNDEVHHILIDRSGALWVATDNGLNRLDAKTGRFTVYKADERGRRSQTYLNMAESPQGVLWLATQYSGLHRLDVKSGQITVFRPKPGDLNSLSDNLVSSVLADDSGTIWAGTHTGLNSFDPNSGTFRAYDTTDGLPSNFVSCLLLDSERFLWMTTNRGISRFDPGNRTFINYSAADGLPGNDMTGYGQCFKSANGRLFFTGYPGAVSFDPRALSEQNYLPNVVLTDLQLFGRSVPIGPGSPLAQAIGYTNHLTLSNEQNVFSFDFAALSYRSPATNRYRYKLDGLDSEWTEVGSDRRRAVYTTLPARSYTFRVQAATPRGQWGTPGTSLRIDILPPWWETWQFRVACAILALVILVSLYQWRLRQVAWQFNVRLEERVGERTRIARDLHDTLLQSFHGVLLRFQAATNLLPERPLDARTTLESAIDQAAQAITEGRDAVQSLRASTVMTNDLAPALRTLGDELASAYASLKPVVFEVEVEGTPRHLHPILRDEIYRVAGEALRNAFRHAQARRIEVSVRYDDRELQVRVRDDGKGIDPAVCESGSRTGHYGLPGMHERASLVKGKLTVWSELEAGTEVELTVPARVAYASPSVVASSVVASGGVKQ